MIVTHNSLRMTPFDRQKWNLFVSGGSLFHPSVCLFVVDVGSVEGLAYHRAWDTLYWTSSTSSTISRKTVDPKRADAFSRQAVVTLSEEDHPHVLALDRSEEHTSELQSQR